MTLHQFVRKSIPNYHQITLLYKINETIHIETTIKWNRCVVYLRVLVIIWNNFFLSVTLQTRLSITGEGHFGIVYRAEQYVLKMTKVGGDDNLATEITILRALVNHTNIVQFPGVSLLGPNPLLLKLCEHGDFFSILKDEQRRTMLPHIIETLVDAESMEHITRCNIVHLDIATS